MVGHGLVRWGKANDAARLSLACQQRARGAARCYPRRVARSNAAKGAPLRRGLRIREVFMPTFMCFLNWTDQGARAVKDASKRYEASKALIAKLGGRLVSAYVTTGQYDVVLTVEMPNGDAMTKFAVSLTSSGNARTTTVRAIPPEEFAKLAAEAP
jgi:uncharacterized protein with GYD domain